jgi:hypothetical protein
MCKQFKLLCLILRHSPFSTEGKCWAFCLSVFGFTSPRIGEPLASGLSNNDLGSTFGIFDAKSRAIVVAKIELGNVAVKMRFTAVLVDALGGATMRSRSP